MSLNKDLLVANEKILWDGKEVAVVRGLTPQDLSDILTTESDNIIDLFNAGGSMDLSGVDLKDNDAVAAHALRIAPEMLMVVAERMPSLISRIIACAADERDAHAYVQRAWPAPLQIDAVRTIFQLTFVGPAGFRTFLGNVTSLVSTTKALISPKSQTASRSATSAST